MLTSTGQREPWGVVSTVLAAMQQAHREAGSASSRPHPQGHSAADSQAPTFRKGTWGKSFPRLSLRPASGCAH